MRRLALIVAVSVSRCPVDTMAYSRESSAGTQASYPHEATLVATLRLRLRPRSYSVRSPPTYRNRLQGPTLAGTQERSAYRYVGAHAHYNIPTFYTQ